MAVTGIGTYASYTNSYGNTQNAGNKTGRTYKNAHEYKNYLFQKTFGTSGVNAIGSFQLSQLNSSSVQSQCPQWRYNKTFRGI